jgi:glucosyl-3-phosphoglycerate phosphatase
VISRLFLLRHGRTAWNAESRYQGQEDPPLDSVGRAQAMQVAPLIALMNPDVIVSSDLQRAVQTAEPVADATGLAVIVDERMRERHLGHWQGLTRDEVQARYPDEFDDWLHGRDLSRRGGESRQQVADRAVQALEATEGADTAVVVTHGATAMCLTSALLGLPQTPPVVAPLANCHWTELRRLGERWSVRAHNIGVPGLVIPAVPVDADVSDADA